MMDRDFFDTLPLWPVVMWPIVFTSILYALFSFNAALEKQGVYYDALYKGLGRFFIIFYPVAIVFDTIVHFYLLYVIGFSYILFLPATAIGVLFAKIIFGFMLYAQYVMPIVYFIIVLSFLTLIGVLNIKGFAHYNVLVYGYLRSF